ncbi:MAG TPA: hypothetical protein ENG03_04850 [Thioploca sp.]|nr:MAG: hypothetical protein DRR19_19185 [Gammaproteobacteria bacterium]HDN26414.1 hypothetical protein [Thioploca sp.]
MAYLSVINCQLSVIRYQSSVITESGIIKYFDKRFIVARQLVFCCPPKHGDGGQQKTVGFGDSLKIP